MNNQRVGYLPDERPVFGKLLLYAIQQVVVMFPATVTVALITGFHVSTTIFASGLATICFILITGRKIPLYYGSSFSYLSAISGLMAAQGIERVALGGDVSVLPMHGIQMAQFGIIASGLVSILAGILVRVSGPKAVEKVLPPTITGPVAMIIGLTLAGSAMGDATAVTASFAGPTGWGLAVAMVTLLSTILFSRYLKGFLGQLPLLLGAAVGCGFAGLILLIGGPDHNLFRAISSEAITSFSSWQLGNGSIFALPAFSLPKISWVAVAAIMPIAIATIPESTAHIYQIDLYVNDVAKKKGKGRYDLVSLLDRNLIGDGLCDMVTGFIGGPAGTNYGENISTMAITRVFSISVLVLASVFAMIVSCFTPLIQAIYGIPQAVIGGLEIYLFGAIAAQGIGIMIEKKVDMFSSKNIAVIASTITIGLGVYYGLGGSINLFGWQCPAIAGAAIFGILLNLLLSVGDKKASE